MNFIITIIDNSSIHMNINAFNIIMGTEIMLGSFTIKKRGPRKNAANVHSQACIF